MFMAADLININCLESIFSCKINLRFKAFIIIMFITDKEEISSCRYSKNKVYSQVFRTCSQPTDVYETRQTESMTLDSFKN